MNFKNGNSPLRGVGNDKRFGNIPLPVEDSTSASNGEFMVGRTTGHMYVRSGGKNVSKTVELEEFLHAFRVGCINMLRSSGDFDKFALGYTDASGKKYEGDWRLAASDGATISITAVADPELDRKVFKIESSNLTGANHFYLFNSLYKYMNTSKIIFRNDEKYTISFMAKGTGSIGVNICRGDSKNTLIKGSKTVSISGGWKKYEVTIIGAGLVDTTNTCGLFLNMPKNAITYLADIQLEPGDRSSAWRHSWYDYFLRMDNLNNDLKTELLNKITLAITECKNYTDAEITTLTKKVETWITNAYDESVKYTDKEIVKVNTTIVNENKKADDKLQDTLCHLNLGQFDWRKYTSLTTLKWDNAKKSVYMDTVTSNTITHAMTFPKLMIPVTETSKYYVEIDLELDSSATINSKVYAGVASYDNSKAPLATDASNSYNYGIFRDFSFKPGERIRKGAIFSGYNSTTGADPNKFDPRASYFSPLFFGNYQSASGTKLYIHSIKVFEIPSCLWNALDAVTLDKYGLMTPTMLQKLNGIEENANKYIHPTSDGNKHVPATGTNNNGKWLKAGSTAGSMSWANLPTDIDMVDGKHANEFVWRYEDFGSQNIARFTNLSILNDSTGSNYPSKNIKLTFNSDTAFANYKLHLSLTVYSTKGISDIIITFSKHPTLSDIHVINSDSDLIKAVSVDASPTTGFILYLESDNDTNLRTVINIESLIIYSNNRPNKALTVTREFVSTVAGTKVSSFNNGMSAGKLDGRDSTSFANMTGKAVNDYNTLISESAKASTANMLTRPSNQDSWLLLDASGSAANYGIYYRNAGSTLNVSGQEGLPTDSLAFIGSSQLMHYHSLLTGDAYHKGNLKAKNINTGRYKIAYNSSDESLEFIFE